MVFYAIAEYYSKVYANTSGLVAYWLAIGGYIVTSATWLFALMQKNMLAVMSTTWSVAYVIVSVALALLVFGEHLTMLQGAGIVLGVISITMLCI